MNVAISLIDTYNTNELKKVDNDKRIIDLEYLKEENKKHGIDKEYKLEIIGKSFAFLFILVIIGVSVFFVMNGYNIQAAVSVFVVIVPIITSFIGKRKKRSE